MNNNRVLTELEKDIILSYCRAFEKIIESGNNIYWTYGMPLFQHDINFIRERIYTNTYNNDFLVKNFVHDLIPRFTWNDLTTESN